MGTGGWVPALQGEDQGRMVSNKLSCLSPTIVGTPANCRLGCVSKCVASMRKVLSALCFCVCLVMVFAMEEAEEKSAGSCNLKRGLGSFQACTAKGEEATSQIAPSELCKRKFTVRVVIEP